MITYYPEKHMFKLDTASSSYVIGIFEEGYILNLYYGARVPDMHFDNFYYRDGFASFSATNPHVRNGSFTADIAPLEFSGFGVGDCRKTAVAIRNADGNDCTDFRYVSHRIYDGKPKLDSLPALYENEPGECQTLEITAVDHVTGIEAVLIYTTFEKYSAMTKSVRLTNKSDRPADIEKIYSSSISLNACDYDIVRLYGRHVAERCYSRTPLNHGQTSLSSSRGSSSHFMNPFTAIMKQGSDENHGEVYGINFVYSGNFDITADVDYYSCTRILTGINPDGFLWRLNPGESFQAPEVVHVYSENGLGEMSRTFHRIYRNNLIRGKYKTEKRPLLINSWEAAYFNFDSDKLVNFAEHAKELGIEMLVMDDGWFGKRDNDRSSLGDWYVNEDKLKGGLGSLIDRIHALGLKFGIWYEPEMISPDSDLYRAHPDWCLHVPGRDCSIGRHQLVIDMSRADVRDNIFEQMKSVLGRYKVDYLKWDFNRNLTEAGSALLSCEHGEEIFHRFVLGTYDLMGRIVDEFPDMLLENCSGGGGRFDPGMLYYSPQIWASDNTDAIERISIQFGTSLCYPASTMGAHVSMNGRTSINTRANVALWGSHGYELDPNRLSEREVEEVKAQVKEYHKYYSLTHYGDLYRIVNPWDSEYYAAWELVSEDRSEALLTVVCKQYNHIRTRFMKLRGLDPEALYSIEGGGRSVNEGELYSGEFLMKAGLNLSSMPNGIGDSYKIYFKSVAPTGELGISTAK